MSQSNNILQELRELGSSLAEKQLGNVYSVPAGYFDNLPGMMLLRAKAMDAESADEELLHLSPLLSSISKEMPYAVPSGFFDVNLTKPEATAQEEIEHISPLLNSISREMPYSVPQGYFDNLQPKKPAAKVVALRPVKWYRMAAAAVVIGIVAVTGFFLVRNNNSPATFARFEKKLNKEIKKTSDQELTEFLKYTDAGQDIAFNEPKDEVKEMLKDVPATDLQKFLEEIADPEIAEELPATE